MVYLVSFTVDGMTYARQCGSRHDAATAMYEACSHNPMPYYINVCKEASESLANSGKGLYSTRIMSNIVLTVIAP